MVVAVTVVIFCRAYRVCGSGHPVGHSKEVLSLFHGAWDLRGNKIEGRDA